MQLLIYRLVYPVLWVISRLPWKVFYILSSCFYILVYYIIGYRKKTVTANLELVFPEKSKNEIRRIRKSFYKHMCDMFMEMIKTMSISEKEMTKRFKIIDPHTLKELESKKKSIMVLMGHYASYEWAISAQLVLGLPVVGVYKKIKNKYFDKLVRRIRKRFNARLISSYDAIKEITKDGNKGKLCAYGFIADQSPKIHKAFYWTDFMGITAPAFVGGEVLAKKLDMSVAYLRVEKIKRGYYQAKFVPITENARGCEDFAITKTYLGMLEEQIKEKPEYYLWTHKRWKHKDAKIPEGALVD